MTEPDGARTDGPSLADAEEKLPLIGVASGLLWCEEWWWNDEQILRSRNKCGN